MRPNQVMMLVVCAIAIGMLFDGLSPHLSFHVEVLELTMVVMCVPLLGCLGGCVSSR